MQYNSSPIMMCDMFGFPTAQQQALYLEQYLQSQEAAKGFDDDLDFCPSLTPAELVDILKESGSNNPKRNPQMKWPQQGRMSSSSSPIPSPRVTGMKSSLLGRTSKAVAIVDPNSKTRVMVPGSEDREEEKEEEVGVISKYRQGSFSSDSSIESCESFDMNGVELVDWGFQGSYLPDMYQMQWQQESSQFYNDNEVMYSSAGRSAGYPQERSNNSSLRSYSPLMMAF